MKLTEQTLKALRTDKAQEEHYHDRTPRAGVRVTRAGRKSFFAFYRSPLDGRTRRAWLGEHESGRLGGGPYLTLKDFEAAYTVLRGKVAAGIDPIPEETGAKRKVRSLPLSPATRWTPAEELPEGLRKWIPEGYGHGTVAHLFRQYFEEHAIPHLEEKTVANYLQPFRKHVLSRFGKVEASKLTAEMVRSAISQIQTTAPASAKDVKKILSVAYSWAINNNRLGVTSNPTGDVKLTAPRSKRDRWLIDSELETLFVGLEEIDQECADCLRLILYSGCRPGESHNLLASEIINLSGEKVWRMKDPKNGSEFLIPIQGKIAEVIARRPAFGPLFPSLAGKASYPSKLKAQMERLRKLTGLDYFRPHDLRRTARTHFSMLSIPDSVGEALLNHVKEGVEGTYNLYSYWRERKEALTLWHQKLDTLEAQELAA